MKLKDKVAVVTGAAQGIGLACARRLGQEGARVVMGDRDAERLVQSAATLESEGLVVAPCVIDTAKVADIERLLTFALEQFEGIDIWVNNAGVAHNQDFLSITEADFDEVLGINLRGYFFGLKAAARQMMSQARGGVIINMSSINALVANPSVATYAISKGGVNQVTTLGAVALAPYGIRVVGIGPGTILTEMVRNSFMGSDDARRTILSRTPIGRCGEPEEIASVAAFLASDDASYITGQTIYPDGGRLILNYTVPVPADA